MTITAVETTIDKAADAALDVEVSQSSLTAARREISRLVLIGDDEATCDWLDRFAEVAEEIAKAAAAAARHARRAIEQLED